MPLDVVTEPGVWPTVVSTPVTVEKDGVELPVRSKLNFAGGIVATDNAASDRIDVTVAGGGSSLLLEEDGAVLPARTALNFADGIVATDNPGQNRIDVTVAAGGGGTTPDATSSVKGKVALTNHLAGTAALPAITGVATGSVAMTTAIHDAAPSSLYLTTTHAAVYSAAANKTFVAYLGGLRKLYFTALDHATGRWLPPVYVTDYAISDITDSHGAPSVAVDGAGVIWVIFGTHNSTPKYARSVAPGDISAWTVTTAPSMLLGTYHQLAYDATTNQIYCLFRQGQGHDGAWPSHEWGGMCRLNLTSQTWQDIGSAALTGGGILDLNAYNASAAKDAYVTGIVARNGRIYIAWSNTNGPGHDGTRADACVAYYDAAGDHHMHTMAGTDLGVKITGQASIFACQVVAQTEVYPPKLALDPAGEDAVLIYNRYDSVNARFTVDYSKWNGSSWTSGPTGITNNYVFYATSIRKRLSDGVWEAMCVQRATTGPQGETVANSTASYPNANALVGGDLVILTSATGTSWQVDTVIPRQNFKGGGAQYIHCPYNAQENLIGLVQPAPQQSNNWWGPIHALHRKDANLMAALERSSVRAPVWHYVNPDLLIVVASGSVIPTAYTTVSLATWVPIDTHHVLLKVSLAGTGATGAVVVSFRDSSNGATGASLPRSSDAQVSSRGEWTDGMTFDVLVPVSPDRKIQWMASNALATGGFRIRAMLVG